MGRSFVEIPTQQEGGVATREPIQAIKEQPAQIAGRRELADPFDVSLPAQQGSGSQPAVLRHVIDLLEPGPQTIIQLHERKRSFGLEFSSPFRLIGWRVCDHHADGGGNARQLGAAKLLRVVHIKAHGDATRGNRLSQAIEESMQSLFSIKLSMGDQPAGVVQDGIQEGLHPSATGALNVRPEQKVGLPDLVTKLRFELLAGSRSQQLPRGEATLLEKAVQGGTGNRADGGDQSQFSQQRGAGTVWVLSFQSFDQLGQLWGEGARLPAVPTGLRRQGGKTTTAIPQCPVEQGIDREGGALGIRDLITSRSNFLCSSCELSTRQGLQNQRGDQSVAEEGNFFGFCVHGENLSASLTLASGGLAAKTNVVCLRSGVGS